MRLWTATNQGNWLVTRIHDKFWGFGAPLTSDGGETWFTGVHPDLIWSQVSMTKMKKIGLKICPKIDFFLTSIGKPGHGKSIRHVFFSFLTENSMSTVLQHLPSEGQIGQKHGFFKVTFLFFVSIFLTRLTALADGCRSLPSFSGRLCSKIDWVRAFPGARPHFTGLWAVNAFNLMT